MWWEAVAELAYKMALDCGQAPDFFDMVDELSKHNASHHKISSQTGMSTLLGHDWRRYRKRAHDPICRISHFNGLFEEDRPESVLVKRPQDSHRDSMDCVIRRRSLSPISILKHTPAQLEEQSLSPKSSSLGKRGKKLSKQQQQKEPSGLSQDNPASVPHSSKAKNSDLKQSASRFGELLQDEPKQRKEERAAVDKKTVRQVAISGKSAASETKPKTKKRRNSNSKSGTKEYVVNRLKGVKTNDDGELVYLVEWEGNWDDTWEPYHLVAHLEDDIEQVYNSSSSEIQAVMEMAGHIDPVD